MSWSRREFLSTAALAGTGALLGLRSEFARRRAAAGDDEDQAGSDARHLYRAQYVAEELLRGEGFTDVQYVRGPEVDLRLQSAWRPVRPTSAWHLSPPYIIQLDAGDPIVILAGVHVGCFELFGTDRVRAIRDLKGKTVAVPALGAPHACFPRQHGSVRGPGSAQGHQLGDTSAGRSDAAPRRREDRCASWAFRRIRRSCGRRRSVMWS